MSSGMSRSKRLFVRTGFVTASTLATIFGAQSLATLDEKGLAKSDPENDVALSPLVDANAPSNADLITPSIDLAGMSFALADTSAQNVEPNIVILRHPGQAATANTGAATSTSAVAQESTIARAAIQPPNPARLAAPPPVIVQGQAPAPVVVQVRNGGGAQPAPRPSSRSS